MRSFDVATLDEHVAESGRWKLGVGRLSVASRITRQSDEMVYGVLHFGDHNLTGGVTADGSDARYRELTDRLFAAFEMADLTETLRELGAFFGDHHYTLAGLFRDERRRIVSQIIAATVEDVAEQTRSAYEDRAPLLRFLASIGVPLPDELRSTARIVLNHELRVRLADPDLDGETVTRLLADSDHLGIELDREGLGFELAHTIERALVALEEDPTDLDLLERTAALVDLGRTERLDVDLTASQNRFYRLKEGVFADVSSRTSAKARRWEAGFRELAAVLRVRIE